MVTKPDYQCPRCGYSSKQKGHMRMHLFQTTKQCAAIYNDIELTDEIKEYIIANRVYRSPQTTSKDVKDTIIKKLQFDVAILKNKKDEFVYQTALEQILEGTHCTLNVGVTDITTESMHAEIKSWESWKEAVGQLIVYNKAAPREELRMYLFGKYGVKSKKIATDLLISLDIKPYEVSIENVYLNIVNLHSNEITTFNLERL